MKKSIYSPKILRTIILIILTVVAVVFSSYFLARPGYEAMNVSYNGKTWFARQPLLENIFALFDVGVVDIDSDDNLDIYTTNHSGQQHFLYNNGGTNGLSVDNSISQFGFNQDPEFPGLDIYEGPQIDASGFYIYWTERSFILNSHEIDNFDPDLVKGEIQFSVPVRIKQQESFDTNIANQNIPTGAEVSTVEFSAQSANAKLSLSPYNASLPITFKLNPQIPLEKVYVGNMGVHPSSHEFTLYLRDRHGMAWTDLNESGWKDVFIVRGGLRGKSALYPDNYVAGELLISNDSAQKYQNLTDTAGIAEGCNANKTAWVDFDRDDLLDIYISCTKDDPKFSEKSLYPNLLYRQVEEGTFSNVAADVNLDIPSSTDGSFAWFDFEGDGDLDLFWSDAESLQLFANNSGTFESQAIDLSSFTPPNSDSIRYKWFRYKLSLADYDADGDIDVFAASPTANVLINNTDGKFKSIEPAKLGLPESDLTANWVDFDNDGLTDLHLFPHGIYRQNENGQFEATNLLENESSGLKTVLCNWLDYNNDGSRDLLIATQYRSSPPKELYGKVVKRISQEPVDPEDWNWTLALYTNLVNTNHWLQVKLIGKPGNRSAIGAKVELINSNKTQLQVVGQSDGSRASQGHYRLYFGLGKNEQIDRLKVTWPDGQVQEIANPEIDSLITIEADSISITPTS